MCRQSLVIYVILYPLFSTPDCTRQTGLPWVLLASANSRCCSSACARRYSACSNALSSGVSVTRDDSQARMIHTRAQDGCVCVCVCSC